MCKFVKQTRKKTEPKHKWLRRENACGTTILTQTRKKEKNANGGKAALIRIGYDFSPIRTKPKTQQFESE